MSVNIDIMDLIKKSDGTKDIFHQVAQTEVNAPIKSVFPKSIDTFVKNDPVGAKVRFEQARYAVSAELEKHLGCLTDKEAADCERLSKQLPNAEVKSQIRDIISGVLDRTYADNGDLVRELNDRMGVKGLTCNLLMGKTFAASRQSMMETIREGGISQVVIIKPPHAMLMACDPAMRIYRYYDPNLGLYKFDNPKDYTRFVSGLLSNVYQTPFGDTPVSPRDLQRLAEQRCEIVIVQSNPSKSGDLALGNGVCAALTAYVASWLKENPEAAKGDLMSEMLGLTPFDAGSRVA